MAKAMDANETVTLEELTISNSYEIAALISLLERKGLLTREEVLEEIRIMHQRRT